MSLDKGTKITLGIALILVSFYLITGCMEVSEVVTDLSKDEIDSWGVDRYIDMNYSQSYEAGVYDCTEMAIRAERYFDSQGYDALMVCGWEDIGVGHAWVEIEKDGKTHYFEATRERFVPESFYNDYTFRLSFLNGYHFRLCGLR